MLGFRGCRLGITYPEITEMQVRQQGGRVGAVACLCMLEEASDTGRSCQDRRRDRTAGQSTTRRRPRW